jgi:hypothetical protein
VPGGIRTPDLCVAKADVTHMRNSRRRHSIPSNRSSTDSGTTDESEGLSSGKSRQTRQTYTRTTALKENPRLVFHGSVWLFESLV